MLKREEKKSAKRIPIH